jgi:hypothetical protein
MWRGGTPTHMRSNAVGGVTRTLCLAWEVAIMMPLHSNFLPTIGTWDKELVGQEGGRVEFVGRHGDNSWWNRQTVGICRQLQG